MTDNHIPRDTMELAQTVWDDAASQPTDSRSEVVIAKAIVADRQRLKTMCLEAIAAYPDAYHHLSSVLKRGAAA